MMLSTLLSPRGGVMKPLVGCATVRLIRDNKCIKTIMIPRTSYQTRPNQETLHIYYSCLLVPYFTD